MITRRNFLLGAPALVAVTSIMKVKPFVDDGVWLYATTHPRQVHEVHVFEQHAILYCERIEPQAVTYPVDPYSSRLFVGDVVVLDKKTGYARAATPENLCQTMRYALVGVAAANSRWRTL